MKLKLYRSKTLDELLADCIRDDARAQQELYVRFSPAMFAVCLRYIRERGQAEDVLLMAFMKVFRKLKTFRGEGSLEGWIRRIVVNEALMHLRQEKTLFLAIDEHAAEAETAVEADHLQAEDLLRLLLQLPAGYRTVFNLYVIEGYGHAEIAEMLGISEGTSKSQLSRAKAMLRHMIELQEKKMNEKISLP